MPSVTKMAAFHSGPLVSRVKARGGHHKRSVGVHGYPPQTLTRQRAPPSPLPLATPTSIPTLPDIHDGGQWNSFLHTLLSQDDEETARQGSEVGRGSGRKGSEERDDDAEDGRSRARQSRRVHRQPPSAVTEAASCDEGGSPHGTDGGLSPGDPVSLPSAPSKATGSGDNTAGRSPDKGRKSSEVTAALSPSAAAPTRPVAAHRPRPDNTSGSKAAPLPAGGDDVISQWTTCRALDSSQGEDGDEDEDEDDGAGDEEPASGLEESQDPDSEKVDVLDRSAQSRFLVSRETARGVEGCGEGGVLSRATSTRLYGRRKRPLLLPPILLPPIYSVPPPPLRLRDELYFVTASLRRRRPFTDDDWDKLRDCRYLRLRNKPRTTRT